LRLFAQWCKKNLSNGYSQILLNKEISDYAYKHGVKKTVEKKLNARLNTLASRIEKRSFDELKAADLHFVLEVTHVSRPKSNITRL
jgi:hypothetical protein